MKTPKECAFCKGLQKCEKVTIQKLETGYSCDLYERTPKPVTQARRDIIRDFGSWALGYEVTNLHKRVQAE